MERTQEARQPEPPPSRPPPPHSPDTLSRRLARWHTHTPRPDPHLGRRHTLGGPEPRQPQRDGGGAHGAPRRPARGAPCPDWAPAPVDVGAGGRRDHLGLRRRSRAPRGPGCAAPRAAASPAAGRGKPVAGGPGDSAERRRARAPAGARAAAPARGWRRRERAGRSRGTVAGGCAAGTGHPCFWQTRRLEEASPSAAPQRPGARGRPGPCLVRRLQRKPSSGQGSPGGGEGSAGRGGGGRGAPAAQHLVRPDRGLGPQPSHGALVRTQQQREYPRAQRLSPSPQ